jgi:phenylalanyl-tRNA synthetase beta chain
MRVSLNSIKQYTTIDVSVDELVKKINEQLGGVEDVIDFGARYKDALIVKIVSCEKHGDADRLSICKVDDAGVVQGIERDENGHVQVVCGAPNARADILAVWLPPRSVVPATIGDKEPMVLDSREFRGVMSNGMLAAGDELAIGSNHDGILEIDASEWKPSGIEIKPGASFAQAYGLDDTIIDIENKMFTHRPDCFGLLGIAREIAGIQHIQFVSPKWYKHLPEFSKAEGLELIVKNDAKEKVPRFMAVAIKDITIKPSPLWIQCELVRLGSKPINNVVDVTNYVMLLTGQPLHAYDYDKLRGHVVGARFASKDEKIELLNGKSYTLDESDIVIVDNEGPIGLGGVMGGGNSEVSETTKNIVIECANFDMYAIRKTSMRHGLFTDAVTRYNKGQSPLQNPYVLDLAMKSILDTAGGEQASLVFDEKKDGLLQDAPATVEVSEQFINKRLGLDLKAEDVKKLLEDVEFGVEIRDSTLSIHAPFWRTDIDIPEDVVEEVGRLYGFDKLPRKLPKRSIKPVHKNSELILKSKIRDSLARAGANEVLTYSFVHEKILQMAGQDSSHAFKLSNPLSPDLQHYRLSLTPSLLDKVHMNQRAGYDKFALFEIGKTHFKGEMDKDNPDVPNEDSHIAFVLAYSDKEQPRGAPYYYAKQYLGSILDLDAVAMTPLSSFDLSADEWGKQLVAPYEPARSAVIIKDGQIFGVVGEFKASVQKAFKLPRFAAGFEIHLDAIILPKSEYKPLSRFPSTERDVCFQVSSDVTYQQIIQATKTALIETGFDTTTDPIDIFQPEYGTTKNVTIRIRLVSHDKTLSSDETNQAITAMVAAVGAATGAKAI